MILSHKEKKCLRRLERQELNWRWIKWPILFGSIGMVAAFALLLIDLSSKADSCSDFLAVIIPLCWVMVALGSAGLGLVITRWGGDIRTQLLLKVITDLEKAHEKTDDAIKSPK